jgi:hypothetical protein
VCQIPRLLGKAFALAANAFTFFVFLDGINLAALNLVVEPPAKIR